MDTQDYIEAALTSAESQQAHVVLAAAPGDGSRSMAQTLLAKSAPVALVSFEGFDVEKALLAHASRAGRSWAGSTL